jgi:hypothetical protein
MRGDCVRGDAATGRMARGMRRESRDVCELVSGFKYNTPPHPKAASGCLSDI